MCNPVFYPYPCAMLPLLHSPALVRVSSGTADTVLVFSITVRADRNYLHYKNTTGRAAEQRSAVFSNKSEPRSDPRPSDPAYLSAPLHSPGLFFLGCLLRRRRQRRHAAVCWPILFHLVDLRRTANAKLPTVSPRGRVRATEQHETALVQPQAPSFFLPVWQRPFRLGEEQDHLHAICQAVFFRHRSMQHRRHSPAILRAKVHATHADVFLTEHQLLHVLDAAPDARRDPRRAQRAAVLQQHLRRRADHADSTTATRLHFAARRRLQAPQLRHRLVAIGRYLQPGQDDTWELSVRHPLQPPVCCRLHLLSFLSPHRHLTHA